ncbi:MAG: hypothetical protein V4812_00085 [Pseudomonadota bacterium]
MSRLGFTRQRGVVLILVLWVIALLMLLLVAFSASVRVDRGISADLVQRVQGRAAAEAALNYLAAIQRMGDETWPQLPGRVFVLPFEGADVRFRLVPEEAYISLKGASPELLTLLAEAVVGKDGDPQLLVERIVQRRQAVGGGDGQTEASMPLYAVEELALVPGIDRALLEPLYPLLTLDSEHAGVDPRFATAPLLRVLLGDEKARALIAARANEDFIAGEYLDPVLVASPGGVVFRLQVEVGQGDRRRQVEVTSRFGEGPSGYKIMRWNEYTARFDLDLP